MAVQQQALYPHQREAYVSTPTKVETRLIQYQGWTNIVTTTARWLFYMNYLLGVLQSSFFGHLTKFFVEEVGQL